MAVNKVVYDGNTLIDLTGDTVTADKLAVGYTAHGANGVQLTGTGEMLSDYFYISSGDLHTDYKLVINNNLSVAPDYNQTDGSYAQLDTDNDGGGGNIILKSGYEISSSNAYGGIVAAGALDGVTQTQSYGSGTSVSAPQGEARILATHGSMPYSNLTTKAMVEAIATETTSEVNVDADSLNVSGNVYLANNKAIYGTDTNGDIVYALEVCNNSNNINLGYGTYDKQLGDTKVFGNVIRLISRGAIELRGDIADGWHTTTAASIVTGGFVNYMTFGNIAVVRVQDLKFGTTAPVQNDATICSGLPHAAGGNFIFILTPAQNEALHMRVKITSAGLMQTHYANATTASTSRQWFGLAVYPYTR